MKRSFLVPFTMMFILSIFCVSGFYVSGVMAGDVPNALNYQGRLIDSDGLGVSGTEPITFRLYDAANGWKAPAHCEPAWYDLKKVA